VLVYVICEDYLNDPPI